MHSRITDEKSNNKNPKSKNESIIIIIKYGVFGVLWVLFSDRILEMFADNFETYKQMQSYKGWIFVLITMILVYFLMNNRVKLIQNATNKSMQTLEELKASNKEQLTLEKELIYQKDLIQSIIDEAPVIIAICDENGMLLSVNDFCNKLSGYSDEELLGRKWADLFDKSEKEFTTQDICNEIIQNGELEKYESSFKSKDGVLIDVIWSSSVINSGDDTGKTIVSIGMDISERKKYEENIEHMAFYDSLTGLPNRAKFVNEIYCFVNRDIEKNKFAIAYVDVDNFKYINDTLGHRVGDEFLKYISNKLSSIIISPDIVARLGGDEFAILINEIETEEKLLIKVDNIIKSIGKTWNSNNREFFISMSIGVAIYPDDGKDSNTLLINSDIAMYVAKKEGKNKALLYEENIHEDNIWNIHMANKLQKALDNKEFVLYYQPQVDLVTGKIVGLEALVRWIHPTEGFISPEDFIPLAEETGQIFILEQRIIENALIQKKELEDAGFNDIELSINLSSKTLISDSNFKRIESILSNFNVDYTKIVIEITETAAITNIDLAIERLNRLKKKGLKIALDDFGTGYSSITYLKKLPIDIIKLDKSYIKSVSDGGKDVAIVKFILSLANDLGFKVIAEGIETNEQLEYLKNINCQTGQGFYLGMPSPPEVINDLLKNNIIINL